MVWQILALGSWSRTLVESESRHGSGSATKSESCVDLIFFLIFKIQKDPRVCCVLEYLCIVLGIKLKDGVGPSNGSTHWAGPSDGGHIQYGSTRGRAASRSPDAADSPPTLVVFSKCGMEKEGGKSDAIISSCFISHFVSQSNIPDRQDKTSSVS